MTTRIALALFALIAGFVALDIAMGWGASLAGARHFLDLIDAMAFWR